jgi:hypothetical protein
LLGLKAKVLHSLIVERKFDMFSVWNRRKAVKAFLFRGLFVGPKQEVFSHPPPLRKWLFSSSRVYLFLTRFFPFIFAPFVFILSSKFNIFPGVYILENTPPLGGGNIRRCHLGEKIWKGLEKKAENVEEKGRKGKEKGRKGKENEKRGSKRVK